MARQKDTKRSLRVQRISYRELSSSEIEDGAEYIPEPSPEPPAKKRKVAQSQRSTRSAKASTIKSQRPIRAKAAAGVIANPRAKHVPQRPRAIPHSIPTDGIIPNWDALPYEILLQIFQYASTPLRDDLLLRPKPSVNWLLNTARTCRAFKEPALAALYESPPLFEVTGPHDLLALLRTDQTQWSIPYASKIKKFEVDIYRTLAYTAAGRGMIDVASLLARMPQLTEIEITDLSDKPPFRIPHRGKPWSYPDGLFRVLSEHGLRLSRWHWNAFFMAQSTAREWFAPQVADSMETAHRTPALSQLRELSLAKIGSQGNKRIWKSVAGQNTPDLRADRLRQILTPLKHLQSLSLTSCGAFEKAWPEILLVLPDALQSLTIANTLFFACSALKAFLKDRGQNLRSLILDHNQSLDLSFTTSLREFCPRLQRLHMDLTFYNQVTSYEDKNPLFDALLLPDDQPTWPTTLQTLELLNLRQWSVEAAETFFTSLVTSAADLPGLRKLIIKAILNISWRDRAGFRETWISRLQDVFLRKSENPDPALASKRAFRESRLATNITSRPKQNADGSQAIPNFESKQHHGEVPEESSQGGHTRRSQRVKEHVAEQERRQRSPETPETDMSTEDARRKQSEFLLNVPVQGLCEVVDISIDNNRPGEVQFHEEDFLDSEPEEDEEWTGDLPTSEPSYAF